MLPLRVSGMAGDDTRQMEGEEMTTALADASLAYASSIADLRDVLTVIDGAQYLAGDTILRILDAFPDKTMEEISDDANMSISSCYDFAAVCRFYPVDVREHYTRLELTFSHLRLAKRLKTLAKAQDFLDRCALMNWSVRYAAVELAKLLGDPVEPPPIQTLAVTLAYERGRWVIEGLEGLDKTMMHRATLRISP